MLVSLVTTVWYCKKILPYSLIVLYLVGFLLKNIITLGSILQNDFPPGFYQKTASYGNPSCLDGHIKRNWHISPSIG